MTTPTVFVAFDGDGIGRKVGRAVLGDDPDELSRISQAIERGEEVLKAWALEHGGRVIEAGGDEVTVSVPTAAVSSLERVRHTYSGAAGATVSAGVGVRLSHAAKALMASKLRGKDRVTFYDEQVEEQVAAAAAVPQTEADKIAEEYLQKSTGGRSRPTFDEPSFQDAEHSQGEAAETMGSFAPPAVEMTHAASQHGARRLGAAVNEFRQHADAQERADQAAAVRKRGDVDKLRTQVVAALQGVRKQLPLLQQLPPTVYRSVMGLTQAVVALGREVAAADTELAKAEAAPATLRKMLATAMPAGADQAEGLDNLGKKERGRWSGGGLTIPAAGTTGRRQWETNFRHALAERFVPSGDPEALKPMTVPAAQIDRGHLVREEGNRRYELYRRMFRGGDHPPPLLLAPAPNGRYRVVDGNHRHTAGLAEGLPDFKAYVYDPKLKKAVDTVDLLPGGAADGRSPDEFDPEQLRLGVQHELEHTDNAQVAEEIAMDHLAEDPQYYSHIQEKAEKEEGAPEDGDPATHEGGPLDKAANKQHGDPRAHHHLDLPVGTHHQGQVKVRHFDGTEGWKSVRAGQVQGQDPSQPLYGHVSHPVSSREPGAK